MDEQIKDAKEKNNINLVSKLTEQKTIVEAMEYIPLAYSNEGGIGLGGIYGAAVDSHVRWTREANQGVMGVNEWNYTDFMLAAAASGVGQSEFSKTMRLIDKIEDAQWKENKLFKDTKLPEAQKRKAEKKPRLPSLREPRLKGINTQGF